jgi:hypothetical protein
MVMKYPELNFVQEPKKKKKSSGITRLKIKKEKKKKKLKTQVVGPSFFSLGSSFRL